MRLLAALALLFWSTAAIADPDAFSRPLPFLSDNDRATVHLSNSLFRKSWRPAPSAKTASHGLGPLLQLAHLALPLRLGHRRLGRRGGDAVG